MRRSARDAGIDKITVAATQSTEGLHGPARQVSQQHVFRHYRGGVTFHARRWSEFSEESLVILAPCDGTTGRKEIQEGQLIQPGQTLVDIVDENERWIVANYKETQTTHIREGQPVEIEVDAVPGINVFGGCEISFPTAAGCPLLSSAAEYCCRKLRESRNNVFLSV